VVLSVGSNLGDRLAALQAGLERIAREVTVVAVSPVYETAPVGGPPQPDYLNAVVLAESALPPQTLLALAQAAESDAGRERGVRFGPRPLDVDLVVVAGAESDDPLLTLPHPRAHERAFVLAPWADVEPDAVLPGAGPVADLLLRLDRSGIRRRDDLVLGGSR
jgi:2-amino-4-hydroxy-6-hydroxymethyldihydropteridine diphosphokinase